MDSNGLSRRDILKGSVALAGVGAISAIAGAKTEANAQATVATNYDVVIIGAGCSGLVCAIRAAELGLKAAVIEKMANAAGNTLFTLSYFLGVNSKVQKNQGVNAADTTEKFYNDMMTLSHDRGDKVMSKYVAEHCSAAVDWLTDVVGLKWKPIKDTGTFPLYARSHMTDTPVKPAGGYLAKQLIECAKSKGAEVIFNTKAVRLIVDKKLNVLGVKTVTKDGEKDFNAKYGVVIATGGFYGNAKLASSLIGSWAAHMPIRGSRAVSGDVFSLVAPVFPKYSNLDQIQAALIHGPSKVNPGGLAKSGIFVDLDGKRFYDEADSYVLHIGIETAKRARHNLAYIIMDANAANTDTAKDIFSKYEKAKYPVASATTIEELAKKIGLQPKVLANTVDEYNKACKKGEGYKLTPPATAEKPVMVAKSPFYAVPFQGGMTTTFGGPLVNVKAEVVNDENKPIPGLYAIGNVVGGIYYDDYLLGSQLTTGTVFGLAVAEELANKKA